MLVLVCNGKKTETESGQVGPSGEKGNSDVKVVSYIRSSDSTDLNLRYFKITLYGHIWQCRGRTLSTVVRLGLSKNVYVN